MGAGRARSGELRQLPSGPVQSPPAPSCLARCAEGRCTLEAGGRCAEVAGQGAHSSAVGAICFREVLSFADVPTAQST